MSSQTVKTYLNYSLIDELKSLSNANGENLLDTLLKHFLEKAPLAWDNLKKAHFEKNSTAVVVYTHRLNGFSANLGADRLAQLCGELERKGPKAAAPDTFDLVQRIGEEFERVFLEIKQLQADKVPQNR